MKTSFETLALMCLLAGGAVHAEVTPAAREVRQMTAADLEAFLDGIVPLQLAHEDIAGAVVAVVKDGKVLLAKGYGFADVEKRTPVKPDATLFRPGSISKLFTWTAVMQLNEEGKLDLDRDVNQYLDFTVPPAFGKPITLRDIMTHTAGFEEMVRDLFSEEKTMIPLDRYLKDRIPQRIFPPGEVPAYSNYATALAGYIVQRVSGKPLEAYIEGRILSPLGMARSTFRQPLPPDLAPLMSSGYGLASAKSHSFEFVPAYPAGSLSATGLDMARFMMAHLNNGELDGKRILGAESAERMHSRLRGKDGANAMCYGFYEESRNGLRIIGHGGDTDWFHSDLHLILAEKVGFFVSYNSAGKGDVSPRGMIFRAFLDRYYPFLPAPAVKPATAAEDAKAVAGLYKSSRRSDSSFLKLMALAQEAVTVNSDGTISMSSRKDPNGKPKKFEEIGPMLFRETHGESVLKFTKDASGKWTVWGVFPAMVFERASFWENRDLNLWAAGGSFGIILLTLLLWPVGALLRRHYKAPLTLSADDRKWRLLARLAALAFVILLFGWALATALYGDAVPKLGHLVPWIYALSAIGWLAALMTVSVTWNAVRVLGSRRSIWPKLHEAALALSCVVMVWFSIMWHLMNFVTNF